MMQGVLFDLDGVLIDSHEQHEHAWEMWAEEIGRELPPGFFKNSFGRRNESILTNLLGWFTDPEEVARQAFHKEELYRGLVRRDGLVALPGSLDLLRALKGEGIPAALATSTPRENVDVVLEMAGLQPWLAGVVCGSDVSQGKPHPEVFLKAAASIGCDPAYCVVLEDAHVGIEAGLAAGCRVLAVATTHPAESLGKAHAVAADLREVTPATLASLFG